MYLQKVWGGGRACLQSWNSHKGKFQTEEQTWQGGEWRTLHVLFFGEKRKANKDFSWLKCDVAQQSVLWGCGSLGQRAGEMLLSPSWKYCRRRFVLCVHAGEGPLWWPQWFVLLESVHNPGCRVVSARWNVSLFSHTVVLSLFFNYPVSFLQDVMLHYVDASLYRTELSKIKGLTEMIFQLKKVFFFCYCFLLPCQKFSLVLSSQMSRNS